MRIASMRIATGGNGARTMTRGVGAKPPGAEPINDLRWGWGYDWWPWGNVKGAWGLRVGATPPIIEGQSHHQLSARCPLWRGHAALAAAVACAADPVLRAQVARRSCDPAGLRCCRKDFLSGCI